MLESLSQEWKQGVSKAITLAGELFSGLDIKVNYGKFGVSIEIDRKIEKPAFHIHRVLERVDYLARKYHKKVILFFDEFQRVSEVSDDYSIESVIRQIAQESKDLTFIFSGSNRHLLYKVFDDRSRPLYKLCDRIALERISKEEYTKYVALAASQRWNTQIDEKIIDRIIYYTERHPYYMNLLCSKLWKQELMPTIDSVDAMWQIYVTQKRSQVAIEIELLSKNQRKLLTILARINRTTAPRSHI